MDVVHVIQVAELLARILIPMTLVFKDVNLKKFNPNSRWRGGLTIRYKENKGVMNQLKMAAKGKLKRQLLICYAYVFYSPKFDHIFVLYFCSVHICSLFQLIMLRISNIHIHQYCMIGWAIHATLLISISQ